MKKKNEKMVVMVVVMVEVVVRVAVMELLIK
jgi:hypothetical protein